MLLYLVRLPLIVGYSAYGCEMFVTCDISFLYSEVVIVF